MSPIGAFSRFKRGGGQTQASHHAKTPRSPRASKAGTVKDQQHQLRVEILYKNPELFAEFKRRVSESNHFSNSGACFVLHDFLEEIDLPPTEVYEVIPSPTSRMSGGSGNGSFSGILSSLRTMAMDSPQSPDVSYSSSPRSRFSSCPESPQPNLSPTLTPLTPISATSSASSAMTPDNDDDSVPSVKKTKPSHPACLEQPNF